MKEVKDKKVQNILDKLRKSTAELKDRFKKSSEEIDEGMEKAEKEIEEISKNKVANEGTIVICKVTKEEALNGCMKQLNYKVKNKDGKELNRNMGINVPAGIQDGQCIIMYDMGDYDESTKRNSNLIIKIEVK